MAKGDRLRFIIEEARTGEILVRDLIVSNPKIMKRLSGPCIIEFDVDHRHPSIQSADGSGPILLKPWGHWIHAEKTINGVRTIVASAIMKPSVPAEDTGLLHVQAEGFSGYPTKIPWLQNWNPIAVDPFEIFDRVWNHIQSYTHGNMGVQVYSLGEDNAIVMPPDSNTLLLPGFSLGLGSQNFIMDFFAIFIRRVDFTDCGDYLNKLARDIPFDYFEESGWNEDYTAIWKRIQLAYPHGGVLQSNLAFRQNENVLKMKERTESEIEYASDIGVRGWFPGKVYSSILTNADPKRYRRFILEEDAKINSTERSQAQAKRQLSRRQFPSYWETITININHPHAPFGTWDVGDQIRVQGIMPWVGDVDQVHKIIAWSLDEATSTAELTLRAEGAFNYDPIFFDGVNQNMLINPSFTASLFSWTEVGNWTRDSLVGSNDLGAARISCTGAEKLLISEQHPATAGDVIGLSCFVAWEDFVGSTDSIGLALNLYNELGDVINTVLFDVTDATGDSPEWINLSNQFTIPNIGGNPVVGIRAMARVASSATSGKVWYDEFYMTKDN
jgi:hypothetical protein